MKVRKDHAAVYRSLCDKYENIKTAISSTNMQFREDSLNGIKEQLLSYKMHQDCDMLIDLKSTQRFIKDTTGPLLEIIQKQIADLHNDAPPRDEDINIKFLGMLVTRFTNDLNRVIEDIKLNCIENDWDNALLKLIDTDSINEVDATGNTLLMHATSSPYPSIKIISKLLELEADPFVKCRFNETPFSKAIDNGYLEIAQNYLQHKSPAAVELDAQAPLDFYTKLAGYLLDLNITEALGLDEASRDTCFMHIKENYEALGKDSDVLGLLGDTEMSV